MSDTITRPTFYEGEILPAADLVATVEYSRDQMARHDRYLHTWGIVSGLQLTAGKAATTVTGKPYKPIKVTAGIAIDGTGREIVVPDDLDLAPEDFLSQVSPLPDPSVLYPLFLAGGDQPGQNASSLTGACGSSLPTRIQEAYSISFGTPGQELNLNQQQAPGFSDGPGDGTNSTWLVLLGFVSWSSDANNFSDAAQTNPDGVGPRYVGVNAAQVTAGGGSLLLATHPPGFSGPNPVMAVQIQEATKDGKLVFGKLNPDGSVTPVFTVTANGDMTATGKISGVTSGSVRVQSGIAFDGVQIPLPPGIQDPAQADLHIHVTPRMVKLTPPTGGPWIPLPGECFVDSSRTVNCTVRWMKVPPAAPGDFQEQPGPCDYSIIAAVGSPG